MKSKLILLVFSVFVYANSDFLSKDEYQLSLYQNPRGIGCDKCHGLDGSEQIFATYKENGKTIQVIIPSIKNISYENFYKALVSKTSSKNIMPNYYLTNEEIKNLYLYIKKKGEKNDK
ncbi:hypothetical protein AVBRAN12640_05215 [Campylobacter sp. RM12640]|uniref:hypothetical protein n=1 Tax=unclassified Campylobacter TaxID=2593542 RepID=UPI001BDB4217|nr:MULTISPECIES: hypothetical protein [unclassified Campylobacter]MBZ7976577.1 hypothetical protein [Campylobacter sp. RM12637]MBZ7978492.1 hypothetical protein [Campylobacter sp. RM12654]MBZ7980130.1 hypothetical protein [Campylobacter sp. RM12642]MBZ7981931.1 hypothetical protein [Campylobacter sp. RM12640]MBZ7982896.1 hypothetical protein [Campylobacter sp. RM12647]MBZ7989161.1 hypothetical protein [Campylobacter sp. RM12635]MBZ7991158.1 hypothetical protein [Campylobacter sp. RM9331]MBZ